MASQKKMIGEILISLGYVTTEHINEARRHQMRGTGKKIGECLVELGYLEYGDIDRALLVQEIE